jgi:hypothetical protein
MKALPRAVSIDHLPPRLAAFGGAVTEWAAC